MDRAAHALALAVLRRLRSRRSRVRGARVLVLVGGGNNGADALLAAATLARRGLVIEVVTTTPTPHERGADAVAAVHVALERSSLLAESEVAALVARADVVIDGLAGLGTRGALRGEAERVVTLVTAALAAAPAGRAPLVVAVDVPSGIGVDDGAVPGAVLRADLTVTMGALKPGLLLPPAALLAGEVELVDLGLDLGAGPADVVRLDGAAVGDLWPVPRAHDHKYSRGVLGVVAGSTAYPGAAVLATAAAAPLAGMVRYLGPDAVAAAVLARSPEVVHGEGRVQAWLIGSGIAADDGARLEQARAVLQRALADGLPTVVDAAGLEVLPERVGAHVVLTPHAGELARLLGARGHAVERADVEARPLEHLRLAVGLTGATVLLKGAVTLVAGPGTAVHSQADGTPWLATAGAGDVLAGVLGATLAGRSADVVARPALAAPLAAAAALVHGRAARRAGGGEQDGAGGEGGPVTASGVAARLGEALAEILRD